MSTIGITGGTGLVGKHLTRLLLSQGHHVIIFTRNTSIKDKPENVSYAHWDPVAKTCDIAALRRLDALVHLAGAGVADKRWTEKRKQEIVSSRVQGTAFLTTLLQEHAASCNIFIAASATGYYGPSRAGSKPFSETDPAYSDFLANTCVQWEAASAKAEAFARTVILRFGIVLGLESGAFPQFAGPQSFGVVPILGSGQQMVSWIEVDDLARLILFAIEQQEMAGIYNAVAPAPVTNKTLMKTIAAVKGGIKIPVPVPSFALKIALGELSTEVLKSCNVSEGKVAAAGFTFRYPDIKSAVKALLKK